MTKREMNAKIAKENREIVRNNQYEYEVDIVEFQHTLEEHQQVEVITPDMISYYSDQLEPYDTEDAEIHFYHSDCCTIQVVNTSSFDIDSDLVLNFANARHPGGGYEYGANAQEEMLCRQSTLFASLSSKEAQPMYQYNFLNRHPMESDYMLISPCVEVFRDNEMNTIKAPRTTAVLTSPAPNMNGMAQDWDEEDVSEYMINRIRSMALVAAAHGYKRLTLGAWGCGAFGHNAYDVAGYFYQVFEKELYCTLFDSIIFAVYDNTPNRFNYKAFDTVLEHNGNFQRKETVTCKGQMPCLRILDVHVEVGDDMGYAQGIMMDGTPFVAEAFYAQATESSEIHIVMPADAIGSFDWLESTCEYDEDNLRYNWNDVICQDVVDRKEIDDGECLNEITEKLYENRILKRTGKECLYAGCGKDIAGQEVIMIAMYISDEEQEYTMPLIEFQSFLDPENKFVIKNV